MSTGFSRDLHARQQTLATLNTATGEMIRDLWG
jgi:hypothetical protein